MDGVLVDFERGMMLEFNRFMNSYNFENETHQINKHYTSLARDLGSNFRLTEGGHLRELKKKSTGLKNLTYALVSKNPGCFFEHLPPLDDGVNDLWTFLNDLSHEVTLLTAGISGPSHVPNSEIGKKKWADKHLVPKWKNLICTEAKLKRNFATENGIPNILIDDREDTVEEWNTSGGFGILHFPKRSNDTILKLKEMGVYKC